MSDLNEKVITSKNALMTALGDNSQKYLNNMKLWFRNKWSKEEFDIESRKLLTSEKMHLHNQFLLAILNKIDTFVAPQQPLIVEDEPTPSTSSRSSRKRKRNSRCFGERMTFEPMDLFDYLPDDNLDIIRPPNSIEDNPPPIPQQIYCVQETFLPDARFMMGRLLVGAWENGLVNVDDVVAEYVAIAVKVLLKNIITAIIMKRKHYAITGDGTYFYDVGKPIKDPFIRNTVTRQKIDDSPLELDKEITLASANLMRRTNNDSIFLSACEEVYPQRRKIITIRDVYKALQDKNIIPSHSIYSINMERISQMLH